MKIHWHFSAENVLFAGVSAIVVMNLVRIGSAYLITKPGLPGTIGKALGSTIHFG